jgi:hypothetical protein
VQQQQVLQRRDAFGLHGALGEALEAAHLVAELGERRNISQRDIFCRKKTPGSGLESGASPTVAMNSPIFGQIISRQRRPEKMP